MTEREQCRGRRRLSRGSLIVAAALIATMAAAAPASAGNGIVSHERSDARDEAGQQARWTPRQMRRAAPLDVLQREPTAHPQALPAGGGKDGPPGYVDGRPPLGSGPTAARAAAGAAGFSSFSSSAVKSPNVYPNTTNGKLFGRISGFGPYTCSASVVHTPNKSVIFTAGHCVKEPGRGGWASDLTFVPSYDRGARPFGQWTWDSIWAKRAWTKKGNSNFDYAAIVLRKSQSGRVENTVGSVGFAFNIPKRRTYRPVGYPVNRSNTEVMWQCVSSYGGPDPFYRRPGPVPLGIGCDMLGGASGGGWSIAGNRLASVTSFGYDELPNELFGPKLNNKANKLRRKAGREKVR